MPDALFGSSFVNGWFGMAAWSRVIGLLLLALAPGGWVVAVLWVLAKLISENMNREEGSSGRRLARAVASVRMGDVVRKAREQLRPAWVWR